MSPLMVHYLEVFAGPLALVTLAVFVWRFSRVTEG